MLLAFFAVGVFSFLINILGLAGSFFMLQVYDRVVPSHSIPTLVALALLTILLYSFYGFLDVMRGRVLTRISIITDDTLTNHVFRTIVNLPLKQKSDNDALRPARELEHIKSFLSGTGFATLFDLPWLPFYLAICFFLSPLIGVLALGAMFVLGTLNLVAGIKTRQLTLEQANATAQRNRLGEAAVRNAELLVAMGMSSDSAVLWKNFGNEASDKARLIADISSFYSGISKIIRNTVQSASLGLGAYLVINGELSGGAIIAGSIIVARTLAPVEQMIVQWQVMLRAQQAWKCLKASLAEFPEEMPRTALPPPEKFLTVESLHVAIPGQQKAILSNINIKVDAGTVLGVIGPSGSGKSTLVRAITGVWPLLRGRIALDGAGINQWSSVDRSRYIGYMPQISEFLPGTIAANIARLNPRASHEIIVKAAKAAGAHELIVSLPNGYDTQLENSGGLSAGQRQRVALARALYGDPFLVVLDEPNSNLDGEGEIALSKAVADVRTRGGIVVIIAHRSNLIAETDLLLVIEGGVAKAFGPRDAILKAIHQKQKRAAYGASGPTLAIIDNEGQPS